MPPDFFQRIQRSPIPVPKIDMEAEHEDFAQESPFLPEKTVGFRGVPYKVKVFFFSGCAKESRIKVAAGGTQVGARKTR